jgi:UDP-N-acetylglucosamine 2-epimerase
MKNICVFTGTRAEYGLLSNLITLIDDDPKLNLTLIVSGTHLVKGFGETVTEIMRIYRGRIKKIFLPLENGMSISSLTA